MMGKNIFRYFASLVLMSLWLVAAACGSGDASAVKTANGNSPTKPAANEAENTNSAEAETPNRNVTPVTVSAGSLFTGNFQYTSEREEFKEKYLNRMMTISDLYLWEVTSTEITASDKKEGGGHFVKCEGSFNDYMDSAAKIKEIKEKGSPVKATLKGTLKDAKEYASSSQMQITLTGCVLAEIEK